MAIHCRPLLLAGLPTFEFLLNAYNAVQKSRGNREVNQMEFDTILEKKRRQVGLQQALIRRNLNENLSGGEKKYNEILQVPTVPASDMTAVGASRECLARSAPAVQSFVCRQILKS